MIDDAIYSIIENFELGDDLERSDIFKLIEYTNQQNKKIELLETIIREGRHVTLNP